MLSLCIIIAGDFNLTNLGHSVSLFFFLPTPLLSREKYSTDSSNFITAKEKKKAKYVCSK